MLRPVLASVQSLGRGVLQAVAPQRCIQCLAADTWLCRPCAVQLTALPRPELTCLICGEQTARGSVCRRCRSDTQLTGALAGAPFGQQAVRRAVHWLKFRGVRDMAPLLAALMAPTLSIIAPLRELQHSAVLIALPLHRRRQRERGYNQSEHIAAALSELTAIPTRAALHRVKETAPQSRLPSELRGPNVAGAFRLRPGTALARRVVLVDDVLTTGSTLMAAAAAMADASGVQEIWGVTAAR